MQPASSTAATELTLSVSTGLISDFTGVSAPYETPEAPALAINSAVQAAEHAARDIAALLALRFMDGTAADTP